MATPILIRFDDQIINIADISTVTPMVGGIGLGPVMDGLKVTFMSKATYVFLPGMTAEDFMDRLAGSVELRLPELTDAHQFDDGDDDYGDSDPDGGSK